MLLRNGASEEYYYYIFNAQGDVIGILDSTGTQVVEYTYNAWGEILSVTGTSADSIGQKNPLRYRGYYYDAETGLYYLLSRYYDSETGRFINADSVIAGVGGTIQGYNMFAYCFNNPVNMSDSFGHWPSLIKTVVTVLNIIDKALTVKCDVPLYNQGRMSLCWAYCQTMIEDYQTRTVRTQEEADNRAREIAVSVHGEENWNRGGWPTNCEEYNMFGTPIAATGINSIVDLYVQIKREGPLYAYYSGSGSAHLIVVTGVNIFRGVVYTNNPWGVAGQQTYAQFLNGFVNGASDGSFPFKFYILTD